MTISMYQASVPLIKKMLTNLSAILGKAETFAQTRGFDGKNLAQARLAPDMFVLAKQIQIAGDMAKGGVARLAGVDIPAFEDTEQTISDLQTRIAKTIAFLDTVRPEQIDGSEAREIKFAIREHKFEFTGQAYLLDWVLPNFFFHVTTAYNLLRHNGVDIGKRDYLG
jgi:hypothetical protein